MERQPPGTPLELRYLVNALVRVPEWFGLGLQLGVAEHVLKTIDQDHRGQTDRCKSAMLSEWLKNGLDHSWERVDTAVKEVKKISEEKRRLDEEKAKQQVEERKTLEAVSQIEKAMEKITTFDECAEEKKMLAKALEEKNREWENLKSGWRNEDEQWIEQEGRRQRIEEAIATDDLESEFVRRYLREKSVPADISKEAVESCLREGILHEKVVRAQQLLNRHLDTKNHQRALTRLKENSEKWIEQLEDHRKRLEGDIEQI